MAWRVEKEIIFFFLYSIFFLVESTKTKSLLKLFFYVFDQKKLMTITFFTLWDSREPYYSDSIIQTSFQIMKSETSLYYNSKSENIPFSIASIFALKPLSNHKIRKLHIGWIFAIFCSKSSHFKLHQTSKSRLGHIPSACNCLGSIFFLLLKLWSCSDYTSE